ncbi:hypothetical protein EVAR_66568_1 [Eumeta japonica]|uniref:HTH CENPB-type domain-containing protein n=1 Tax=Eumeta variegata TaxID=151549 RepID=A0A4C2ABB0_EUMVA|nr:hypothetical protein EVAR_66568_1 [Eumeta japonica]
MALQFKSAMGLQNFFPHQEWCDKFRTTYKIPTCDSKLLSIGYTQGHSVQIKDVMKDVLSECSPDAEDDDDDQECHDDGEANENEFITLDSDEGEIRLKSKLKNKTMDKNVVQNVTRNTTNSHPMQMMPSAQLQGLRQLVALPIPTNGLPGMSQKVLVATPIVAPGQKQAALASNALNHNNNNNNNNHYSKDQHVNVPPPMFEIKKEIKTEPKDDEDTAAENCERR